MTYTVGKLPVPTAIYVWIREQLLAAGYDGAVDDVNGMLDMTHIALADDGASEAFSALARAKSFAPTLYAFQERIQQWLGKVFDAQTRNSVQERALRLCEEAIELAQALGTNQQQLHKLIDYVYDRPVGSVGQEIAGTMVTLVAVACAAGCDLEGVTLAEADRIERPEIIKKIQDRQAEKRAALMTGV